VKRPKNQKTTVIFPDTPDAKTRRYLRFFEALFGIDDPEVEQAIVVILEGLARSRATTPKPPPSRPRRRKIPKRTKAS
jgi:hypothetical protein